MKPVVIFAIALSLAAQSTDQSRFSADVTRVNLLFTVSDRKGRFVQDLIKDDFEILEGKKQQSIVEFTSEANLPLRLAIPSLLPPPLRPSIPAPTPSRLLL